MKEEDKRKACQLLQEIEADLAFRLIESYQQAQMEEFIDTLEILRTFIELRKELCQ